MPASNMKKSKKAVRGSPKRNGAEQRTSKSASRKKAESVSTSARSAPRSASVGEARYDVHPSVVMVQDWIAGLKSKTGRSLDEWIRFIQKNGPADEKASREWLRTEHGLGTNSAWWLAERARGKGFEEDDPQTYLKTAAQYVEDMYAGAKSALRPIHDALIRLGRSLGGDVKVCPCKTIVPLYRRHVIAQIKPSTRTRIDFGFALGDRQPTGRLIDTGGFEKKDRITHRIPISSVEEIDPEVKNWLKVAYDLDA